MEEVILCKGGCGNAALHSGWCGIRWKTGNLVSVTCPDIEKRRGEAISKYRLKESKLGLNPMQNPKICKKNHSLERNKKASETLKKMGKLHLLPQQIESKSKNHRRLTRIRKALQALSAQGKLNHQIESTSKKKLRHQRISNTLKAKVKDGTYKLPVFKKIRYRSLKNGILYLRSKWELEVARFLDKRHFIWSYEYFSFPYWNPSKREIRYTIPDFFLHEHNIFIEVKSDWERIENPSRSKIKGVRDAGYPVLVWQQKQIDLLRNFKYGPLLAQIESFGEKNV